MTQAPGKIEPVPTEVFADHMVLRPPNKLKDRATRIASVGDLSELSVVNRAEHALSMLSQEFDAWMDAEIVRLENARRAASAEATPDAFAALYRSAHDLRGQSATFGFPLAGEIADGLCTLIERLGAPHVPQEIIDRHVESIRAIVREDARNYDHPIGAALTARLAEMRDRIAPPIVDA